jgi:hypothetical protein
MVLHDPQAAAPGSAPEPAHGLDERPVRRALGRRPVPALLPGAARAYYLGARMHVGLGHVTGPRPLDLAGRRARTGSVRDRVLVGLRGTGPRRVLHPSRPAPTSTAGWWPSPAGTAPASAPPRATSYSRRPPTCRRSGTRSWSSVTAPGRWSWVPAWTTAQARSCTTAPTTSRTGSQTACWPGSVTRVCGQSPSARSSSR